MDFNEKWQSITGWKRKISRLPGKMKKENWILLLCLGLILMIVAAPLNGKKAGGWQGGGGEQKEGTMEYGGSGGQPETGAFGVGQAGRKDQGELGALSRQPEDLGSEADSYEVFLENRVRDMLKRVEGVGEVDVLIVLKSSEQKVYQTDGRTLQSSTKEQDSSGGIRDIAQQEEESSTVIVQGGGQQAGSGGEPRLEKELRPEISGIVISAQGGGLPSVKAEITDAMAALFDLPAHKIKVLKRTQ